MEEKNEKKITKEIEGKNKTIGSHKRLSKRAFSQREGQRELLKYF